MRKKMRMQYNTCSKAPINDSRLIGISGTSMLTAASHMTNENADLLAYDRNNYSTGLPMQTGLGT